MTVLTLVPGGHSETVAALILRGHRMVTRGTLVGCPCRPVPLWRGGGTDDAARAAIWQQYPHVLTWRAPAALAAMIFEEEK